MRAVATRDQGIAQGYRTLGVLPSGEASVADDAVVIAEVARAFPFTLRCGGAVECRQSATGHMRSTVTVSRFLKKWASRDSDLNISALSTEQNWSAFNGHALNFGG